LAEAVAGNRHRVGLAVLGTCPPGERVDDKQSGLRKGGLRQFAPRVLEAQLPNRIAEDPIRLGGPISEAIEQIPAHADRLRPLTRKQTNGGHDECVRLRVSAATSASPSAATYYRNGFGAVTHGATDRARVARGHGGHACPRQRHVDARARAPAAGRAGALRAVPAG